ncbi:MAG: hypothetical protein KH196_06455 [Oscillospiraceae bacterium]|nr:hypothetical protein [Oscillospiraceae bacterium]
MEKFPLATVCNAACVCKRVNNTTKSQKRRMAHMKGI